MSTSLFFSVFHLLKLYSVIKPGTTSFLLQSSSFAAYALYSSTFQRPPLTELLLTPSFSNTGYCGWTLNNTQSQFSTNDNCQVSVCDGNPAEYCGGDGSVMIYGTPQSSFSNGYTGGSGSASYTPLSVTTGLASWVYQGCYNEMGPHVPGTVVTDYANTTWRTGTVPACARQCAVENAGANYAYMALDYMGQCFCGNTLDPRAQLNDVSNCHLECDGDSTEYCGGNGYAAVYGYQGLLAEHREDSEDAGTYGREPPAAGAAGMRSGGRTGGGDDVGLDLEKDPRGDGGAEAPERVGKRGLPARIPYRG
ncbi:MAG: hypothetical protein LQ340_005406, partial [Diploschistes diacapsis]